MKQDHYKNLIMSAPVGYAWHKIVLDERGVPCDYVFLDVNPAFERLTGLSSLEIINRRVTEVLPGITDDEFDWIGKYGKIACDGGEMEFEQYSKPLDKWYRIQAGSSERGFFSTVFVDITDMKRTEEEQNLLLDNINTQVWYLSDPEHYGKVNRAHAGFMGKSEEELKHQNLYDFLGKDEADLCCEVNKKVFEEKRPVTTEEWVANGQGERRLLRITKNPKLDHKGEVEFVVCSAEDITERRKEKQALRQSEEKFRKIFENAPLGFMHFNAGGIITECNDYLARIIGSSQKAITGLNLLKLPDKGVVAATRRALKGELSSYEGNYQSTTADKTTPVRALFAPLKLGSDVVAGGIGIIEDITERKKGEELIRNNLQEKNVLLSEIHHRVKNNMAVISSLLTLQPEINGADTPDKVLRDTRTRVHSMALVHELVYETNNFAEIDFKHLLQRLIDNLDKVYGRQHQNIEITISSDDILLDLNQSIPCTLLVNELITNAYLHAFEGRSHGKIEVLFHKTDDGYARLVVRDDGKGMAQPELLENPESFGYTIIHGLVRQIGGTIRMDSINSGLTIEVRFKPAKPFDTVSPGLSGSDGVS